LVISGVLEETARAKVNLALHVTGRRSDGYHLIDSIVLFADISDRLSFARAERTSLHIVGPFSGGLAIMDNLVLRAHAAMARAFGGLIPEVGITLEKHIPLAAGLGGGSADAAAALRLFCRIAGLDPLSREIRNIALSLGADVPVCLYSRACRVRGIGELIEPLHDLPRFDVVLANADVTVSTASVFAALNLKRDEPGYPPVDVPFALSNSRNDLTPPAMALVPQIADVLNELHSSPAARFARMSGSGGACFAVFDNQAAAGLAAAGLAKRHPDWWVTPAILR
jgi:4-diphosphocytidyl-2-C-methyl-D-erythritol kinase